MGWWSDLFSSKGKREETEYHPELGLLPITETVPMPEVKPPKPEKDISEPVLSFVECVRNNPARFRITNSSIVDRNTSKTFSITRKYWGMFSNGDASFSYHSKENTSWMTRDEMEYAYKHILEIQQDKVKAYKNKQRQKYIQIYVDGQ